MSLTGDNTFDILSEAISEGVIIVDENQMIVATNSASEQIFGYEKGELKGQSLNILIPQQYQGNHGNHFQSFMKHSQKRQMGIGRDIHGVKKNGDTFPVEAGLSPFQIYDKTFVMALVIDITERKNYTEKLESTVKERTKQLQEALEKEKELNELKTKFLSLVSHEFKTPLSGILTSTTLIGKYQKTEQQEKREKHLHTIKSKVKYLDNILTDFLSIERLDSGKVNYKFSTFPLSKVINEVVYDANMLLKDGQKINYPQDIDEYTLEFDEKILELTLTNLIGNAIKYSGEGTTIDLQAYPEKETFVFKVIDQGIGIPEKEQKFIFNRYFRAENALLDQGTGIGLNIVKSHIENLGGSITFLSVENQGTTFTVTIPITITATHK
ncbi:PAS domain-containing sensor histidine kinase [uncultured Aquimarina sp.]|uniref:PAS domain-containing sensor histidine kinase n=1 Tax=uncultured Aquimarina sp. TaxID=575652 RepID=UPI00263248D1|nr:PAS domain-containing sensor histidine kinase [uncultured Aquimarina sp.]